jgi:hypothetical protein
MFDPPDRKPLNNITVDRVDHNQSTKFVLRNQKAIELSSKILGLESKDDRILEEINQNERTGKITSEEATKLRSLYNSQTGS